jgi:hypothetical protein
MSLGLNGRMITGGHKNIVEHAATITQKTRKLVAAFLTSRY